MGAGPSFWAGTVERVPGSWPGRRTARLVGLYGVLCRMQRWPRGIWLGLNAPAHAGGDSEPMSADRARAAQPAALLGGCGISNMCCRWERISEACGVGRVLAPLRLWHCRGDGGRQTCRRPTSVWMAGSFRGRGGRLFMRMWGCLPAGLARARTANALGFLRADCFSSTELSFLTALRPHGVLICRRAYGILCMHDYSDCACGVCLQGFRPAQPGKWACRG